MKLFEIFFRIFPHKHEPVTKNYRTLYCAKCGKKVGYINYKREKIFDKDIEINEEQ